MPAEEVKPPGPRPAARRLLITVPAGVVVGVIVGFLTPWQAALLIGWIVAAGSWIAWTWITVLRLDAGQTSDLALAEEPSQRQTFALLLVSAVASLVAVGAGVLKAAKASGSEQLLLLSAGIVAIVMSWAVVHTVFTLRYAALYYLGEDGGIDFNEDEKPVYADFAYLAFTIGMTFQVSDTDLKTKAIRHTALRHALLSYLFGAVIIAATVNVASGLAH